MRHSDENSSLFSLTRVFRLTVGLLDIIKRTRVACVLLRMGNCAPFEWANKNEVLNSTNVFEETHLQWNKFLPRDQSLKEKKGVNQLRTVILKNCWRVLFNKTLKVNIRTNLQQNCGSYWTWELFVRQEQVSPVFPDGDPLKIHIYQVNNTAYRPFAFELSSDRHT